MNIAHGWADVTFCVGFDLSSLYQFNVCVQKKYIQRNDSFEIHIR